MISGEQSELTWRGLSAVSVVAAKEGLHFAEPKILRDRGNLLVHLAPAPVVARAATLTGTRRAGDAWLRREVAVAGFLACAGAPVVAPSAEIDPGPHTHKGISLSFWDFVEEVEAPLDAAEAGRRLRVCHEALADYGEIDPKALDVFVAARRFQGTLWSELLDPAKLPAAELS